MIGNGEQTDIKNIHEELIPPHKVNDNEVHVYSPYEKRKFVLKRGRYGNIVLQNGNEEYNLMLDEESSRTSTVPRIVTRYFRNTATGNKIAVSFYCPNDDELSRRFARCLHFNELIGAVNDCNNTNNAELLFLCWNAERRQWFYDFLLGLANDHRSTVFGAPKETKEFFASLYYYGIIDDSFLTDGIHCAQDFLQSKNLPPTPEMVRKVKDLIKEKLSKGQVGDQETDTFLSKFASAIQNVKKRVVYFPSGGHTTHINPGEEDDNLYLYAFCGQVNNTMSRAKMKMLAAACLMMRIGENCTIQVDNSNNFRGQMNGHLPNKKINLIDTQNFCYLDKGAEQGYTSLLGIDHYEYYLTMFDSLFDYAEAASRGKCADSGSKKGIEFIISGVSAWGTASNCFLLPALDEALGKHPEISVRFLDSRDVNEQQNLPENAYKQHVLGYIELAEQNFGRQLTNLKNPNRFKIINYTKNSQVDFSNNDKDCYLVMAGDHCAWLGNEAVYNHLPNYWNPSSQEALNKKTDFCKYYMTPNTIYQKKLKNDYGFAPNGAYKYLFNELSMPRKARMWLCNQQQNWRQPKDKDFMMCEPNYKDRENFVQKGKESILDLSHLPFVIRRDENADKHEIVFHGYGNGEDIYFRRWHDGRLCIFKTIDATGHATTFNPNLVVFGTMHNPQLTEPLIVFEAKTPNGVTPEIIKRYTCWCPIKTAGVNNFNQERECVDLITTYRQYIGDIVDILRSSIPQNVIKLGPGKSTLFDSPAIPHNVDTQQLEEVFKCWLSQFYYSFQKSNDPYVRDVMLDACFDHFFELLNQPNTLLNKNKDMLSEMFLKYYIFYQYVRGKQWKKEDSMDAFDCDKLLKRSKCPYPLFLEQWNEVFNLSKKPFVNHFTQGDEDPEGISEVEEAREKIIEKAPAEDEMESKGLSDPCITKLKIEQINNECKKLVILNDTGDVFMTITYKEHSPQKIITDRGNICPTIATEEAIEEPSPLDWRESGLSLCEKDGRCYIVKTSCYNIDDQWFEGREYFAIDSELYNKIQKHFEANNSQNKIPKMSLQEDYIKSMIAVAEQEEKRTNTPYDTVESIEVADDDEKFPTLQFLNQNGDVIATYDHYNGREFKTYKDIKTKNNTLGTDSFFVYDDNPGEGKNIFIGKKKEGKYYILPLSDNLYNQIMKKLPKRKAHIEDKEYYFTMRDIAKKQEAKINNNNDLPTLDTLVVTQIVISDDGRNALELLNSNNQLVARFWMNNGEISIQKNSDHLLRELPEIKNGMGVLMLDKTFSPTGKAIVLGNGASKQHVVIPISNDLYKRIHANEEKLCKGKTERTICDVYKSMCAVAVQDLSKLKNDSNVNNRDQMNLFNNQQHVSLAVWFNEYKAHPTLRKEMMKKYLQKEKEIDTHLQQALIINEYNHIYCFPVDKSIKDQRILNFVNAVLNTGHYGRVDNTVEKLIDDAVENIKKEILQNSRKGLITNKNKTKSEMCQEVKKQIKEKISEFVKLGTLCLMYFKTLNERKDISEYNKQLLYAHVNESAVIIQSKLEVLMKYYSNEDMIKDYVNKQIKNSSEISKRTLNDERTKGL